MKWRKTKVQFPLKNAESGIYYARLFFNGKEVWKSLKTDVYSPPDLNLMLFARYPRSQATGHDRRGISLTSYELRKPHCHLLYR
jgi:hypothetical protein